MDSDIEYRIEKKNAKQRILWDFVLLGLCGLFCYTLIGDFLAADRTAGWTSQSYFSLGGTVVFVLIAVLLAVGLVKKIKEYKNNYED